MTSIYRYRDVLSQTGKKAYFIAHGSYVLSQVMFVTLAFTAGMPAGIAVLALILGGGTCIAAAISKNPEVKGP